MLDSYAAQEVNYALSISWARQFNIVKGQRLTSWVSSFRAEMPCSVVKFISGTFNMNCHIRFLDGAEWIVRFPVSGRAMGDVDAKVRHEVSVMKLIRGRTKIPVPEIVAWGVADSYPLGLGPYIIMHYVEGRVLGKLLEVSGHLPNGKILRDDIDPSILEHVYRQCARFVLDLADIEFLSIGTIVEHDSEYKLESGPITVKMNDIERKDGIQLGASQKPHRTTIDFFQHVLSLEMEHLRLQVNSTSDAEEARKKYKRLRRLTKRLPSLVDSKFDAGPFVLRCEGMRFGNMLVDDNYNITAVLDWEWTYTSPKQLVYSPPRWLIVRRPMHWNTRAPWQDVCSARYLECFNVFIKILADEEDVRAKACVDVRVLRDEDRLSHLMSKSLKNGLFWFHELLLAPEAHSNEVLWAKIEGLLMRTDENKEISDEEIKEFVDWKMSQLQKLHEQQDGYTDGSEGNDRRNLLGIGIDELVRTC